MPDLLTHFFLAVSLALLLRIDSWEKRSLIVVGGLMSDLERPFSFIIDILGFDVFKLTIPFHSILGTILLSLFVSTFFDLKDVRFTNQFQLVFLGGLLHLLADMTLHPWEERGIFLLYPLKIPFSFNLFWPGFLGYPIIGLILFLISLAWFSLTNLRKNPKKVDLKI